MRGYFLQRITVQRREGIKETFRSQLKIGHISRLETCENQQVDKQIGTERAVVFTRDRNILPAYLY